jgi:hypothetical protein
MAGLSGVWHTPPLLKPFVFFQVRASMKWEMWTSTMCLLHMNLKRGVFRMLLRTKMVPGKHPSSGTCFNTANSIYLTNNIIILQQIQYNFWLITALELTAWNHSQLNVVTTFYIRRCHSMHSTLTVMLRSSSICFTCFLSKWRQWSPESSFMNEKSGLP